MSELLKINEVAQVLRVDTSTVRRWINEGTLEGVRLPGNKRNAYRVKKNVLERLLKKVSE